MLVLAWIALTLPRSDCAGIPDPRVVAVKDRLREIELSLAAPRLPKGYFNPAAAARGQKIFDGKGRCSSCHVPPLYTEPGHNLHKPSETCSDSFIASRSPQACIGRHR